MEVDARYAKDQAMGFFCGGCMIRWCVMSRAYKGGVPFCSVIPFNLKTGFAVEKMEVRRHSHESLPTFWRVPPESIQGGGGKLSEVHSIHFGQGVLSCRNCLVTPQRGGGKI